MALSFWDTVLGHQLADTLNRELPRLTRKRIQYTKLLDTDKVLNYVKSEIDAGNCYVGMVKDRESGRILVIMEKYSDTKE